MFSDLAASRCVALTRSALVIGEVKSRKNDDDDECADDGGVGSARRERVRGWTDAPQKVWRSAKAKRLFDDA